MLHLDNNLDELFKKAGENYSLKDSESAWNDVFAKTNAASSTTFESQKNQISKKYSLIILLLVGLTNLFIAIPLKMSDSKNNFESKPFTSNSSVEISNDTEKRKTTPIVASYITLINKKEAFANSKKTIVKNKIEHQYKLPNTKNININPVFNNPKSLFKTKIKNRVNKLKEQQKLIVPIANNNSLITSTNSLKEGKQQTIVAEKVLEKETNNTALVATKKDEKTVSENSKKGFYVGIVTGPQISQVNSQMINIVGADIGATIGYRFNKKLSVETGLFFSKKHYYSKGEYFTMSKVAASMPANMELISLNGTSNIIEVPLTIKYDFLHKKNSNYFVTAGISSYLLTNESNNYLALVNGVKQTMQGNYNSDSKYYNATINLSIGYEHKLFKKATIRIEPYIQIPIKQMGVGSMPVSTAGVHFGVYLPLH